MLYMFYKFYICFYMFYTDRHVFKVLYNPFKGLIGRYCTLFYAVNIRFSGAGGCRGESGAGGNRGDRGPAG